MRPIIVMLLLSLSALAYSAGDYGHTLIRVNMEGTFNCAAGTLDIWVTSNGEGVEGVPINLTQDGTATQFSTRAGIGGIAHFRIAASGTYSASASGDYYGSYPSTQLDLCPGGVPPENNETSNSSEPDVEQPVLPQLPENSTSSGNSSVPGSDQGQPGNESGLLPGNSTSSGPGANNYTGNSTAPDQQGRANNTYGQPKNGTGASNASNSSQTSGTSGQSGAQGQGGGIGTLEAAAMGALAAAAVLCAAYIIFLRSREPREPAPPARPKKRRR